MASIETLESIGRTLIEKNNIKNYTISIIDDINYSSVTPQRYSINEYSYHFKIGHSNYYGDLDEVLNFIHKKYPATRNINLFVVVFLHEIAHVLDNVNPKAPRIARTMEEYRELPREKAADIFAENFIWNNPKLCEELSGIADKAIEEFWNDQ